MTPSSALRRVRAGTARLIGAAIATWPGLELPFVRAGRALGSRSRLLGGLYWFASDDLVLRLRNLPGRFRALNVAGTVVQIDISDATGRLHYFHGEPYEPGSAAAVAALLRPGDAFIDVGANIGFFSVLAAHLVGAEGRVIAFEPHLQARARLRETVAANGVAHIVEIVDAALAGAPSEAQPLFLSADSVLSTLDPAESPARAHFSFDHSVQVRVITLDNWLRERPEIAPRLAAIKIDVEGAEAAVLQGMRETMAASRRLAVICETTEASGADRILIGAGFSRTVIDVRSGSFGNYLYVRGRAVSNPLAAV